MYSNEQYSMCNIHSVTNATRGSPVGWGTMLQAWRARDRVPKKCIFFNLPNPSGCTNAPGSTQPLTEMSTKNLKKETWWEKGAGA
jgi:hypothetical protein